MHKIYNFISTGNVYLVGLNWKLEYVDYVFTFGQDTNLYFPNLFFCLILYMISLLTSLNTNFHYLLPTSLQGIIRVEIQITVRRSGSHVEHDSTHS